MIYDEDPLRRRPRESTARRTRQGFGALSVTRTLQHAARPRGAHGETTSWWWTAPSLVALATIREKLVKIGPKVVSHGRYVTFQLAEAAVPRELLRKILSLIDDLRRRPAPA